jgi:hypothetical protein
VVGGGREGRWGGEGRYRGESVDGGRQEVRERQGGMSAKYRLIMLFKSESDRNCIKKQM